METSKLFQILSRLYAMERDQSGKTQTRRFEQFGIEVCRVTYDQESETFNVIEYRPYNQFSFDSIDLAAIEIFETLSDLQLTF